MVTPIPYPKKMSTPTYNFNVGDLIPPPGRRRPSTILSRCWGLLKTRHGLWMVTAIYAHLAFCAILGLCLHYTLPNGNKSHRLINVAATVLIPVLSFFVLPATYWLLMLVTLPGGAVKGGLSFVGVFFIHALTHHFVRQGWWQCGAYSAWAVGLVSVAKFMDHNDKIHVIKGTGVSFGQAFIGVVLRPAERDWLVLVMFGSVGLYSLGLYVNDVKDRDSSYFVAKTMLKGGVSTVLADQFPNA